MNSRPAFPDDPELSTLREELARTRNDIIKSGLDQLDAARAVNDRRPRARDLPGPRADHWTTSDVLRSIATSPSGFSV